MVFSSVNIDKVLGLKKVPCLPSSLWSIPTKSIFQENNLHLLQALIRKYKTCNKPVSDRHSQQKL